MSQFRIVLSASLYVLVFSLLYQVGRPFVIQPAMAASHTTHNEHTKPSADTDTSAPNTIAVDCKLFPNDPSCAMSKIMPEMAPTTQHQSTNNFTQFVKQVGVTNPIPLVQQQNESTTPSVTHITGINNTIDTNAFKGLLSNVTTHMHAHIHFVHKHPPSTNNSTDEIDHAHTCPDGSVADANAMCM
jgi:hypothetical protein